MSASPKQAVMWERSSRDETPLETGGAVVVLRLSPDEAAFLRTINSEAYAAIHELIQVALDGTEGQ